jgi:2-phosphosulfolactate phosphatase
MYTPSSINFAWGMHGLEEMLPLCDVVVIVDVLSFCTAVDVAVGRGAAILPYRWKDGSAAEYARRKHAALAGHRGDTASTYSLSPASLRSIDKEIRLVLPSPNGSALSMATGTRTTIAGSLRNARAVAAAAMQFGERILVVAAGERWKDGSLRPAVEDYLGAGAIISELGGSRSPEAVVAAQAFLGVLTNVDDIIAASVSGRELIDRGYIQDVVLAVDLNVSTCVPLLCNGAYINSNGSSR